MMLSRASRDPNVRPTVRFSLSKYAVCPVNAEFFSQFVILLLMMSAMKEYTHHVFLYTEYSLTSIYLLLFIIIIIYSLFFIKPG